jgi:hypothetical protein
MRLPTHDVHFQAVAPAGHPAILGHAYCPSRCAPWVQRRQLAHRRFQRPHLRLCGIFSGHHTGVGGGPDQPRRAVQGAIALGRRVEFTHRSVDGLRRHHYADRPLHGQHSGKVQGHRAVSATAKIGFGDRHGSISGHRPQRRRRHAGLGYRGHRGELHVHCRRPPRRQLRRRGRELDGNRRHHRCGRRVFRRLRRRDLPRRGHQR